MGCSASHSHFGGAFTNKYVLGHVIGEGGFAKVHAVQLQSGANTSLAVKVLLSRDKIGQEAEENEVAIFQRLGSHENCVRCLRVLCEGGARYLVMERCALSLKSWWRRAPRPLHGADVGRMFRGMTLGLAHLHSRRVVHRDVKLDNFLLGGEAEDTVKLCDFGDAAVLPASGVLTGIRGTVSYMSPEMLRQEWYAAMTDMWSLGVCAYTLLYGQHPYAPGRPREETVRAICSGLPEPMFDAKLEMVPAGSESFTRKLLKRVPDERSSAEQLLGHAFVLDVASVLEELWADRVSLLTPLMSEPDVMAELATVAEVTI